MPSINCLLSSLLIAFTFFTTLTFSATLLPNNEVEALEEIAETLGKTDWNFSADPCGGEWGWATKNPVKGRKMLSLVAAPTTLFAMLVLKTQNLPGSLPPELVKLPYLQEIDFTRNYLDGSIPPEWGTMQLVNISLIGNRLTGSIPKELGNISTLANL
ncbi:putative leucine-rich repeat receptor-like serine/threonine-protein kinase [Vitis vinifera]|uniref:Putative leucine-rich repeat receptor-like serine/threonine-protein kinase n=1 Tax=Vitis vinifera TaxID=29760 RepID=A0A438FHA8_VITVI|nr:putative leucine-rich repeat receptor-like serine/threonine-protein kinase [Vitis vinifera]